MEGIAWVTGADEDGGVSGIDVADCSVAEGADKDGSVDVCMIGGVVKYADMHCMASGAVDKDADMDGCEWSCCGKGCRYGWLCDWQWS